MMGSNLHDRNYNYLLFKGFNLHPTKFLLTYVSMFLFIHLNVMNMQCSARVLCYVLCALPNLLIYIVVVYRQFSALLYVEKIWVWLSQKFTKILGILSLKSSRPLFEEVDLVLKSIKSIKNFIINLVSKRETYIYLVALEYVKIIEISFF